MKVKYYFIWSDPYKQESVWSKRVIIYYVLFELFMLTVYMSVKYLDTNKFTWLNIAVTSNISQKNAWAYRLCLALLICK